MKVRQSNAVAVKPINLPESVQTRMKIAIMPDDAKIWESLLADVTYSFMDAGPIWALVRFRSTQYGVYATEGFPYCNFVSIYRRVFTAHEWDIVTKPVLDWIPG